MLHEEGHLFGHWHGNHEQDRERVAALVRAALDGDEVAMPRFWSGTARRSLRATLEWLRSRPEGVTKATWRLTWALAHQWPATG